MQNKKIFIQKKIILDVLAIIIILGAFIYFARPLLNFLGQQQEVVSYVIKLGALGPIVIIILETFSEILAGLPGVNSIAGYIYGPALATIYSLIGGTIGAIISFYFARLLGRPILKRLIAKEKLSKFNDFIGGKIGIIVLFFMFLIPFLPDNLACFAAGLSPLSLPGFIIIAILGRFPPVLVSTLLGAQIKTGYSTGLLIYIIIIGLFLAILYLFRDKIETYLLKRKK